MATRSERRAPIRNTAINAAIRTGNNENPSMLGYSGPKMSIAQGNAVNAVQTKAPNGTTEGRSANAVRMKQWKLMGGTNAVVAKFIALLRLPMPKRR